MENKYNKSIIYQITCNDPLITETYVGSTTNLTNRINQHKFSCNTEYNEKYNFKIYKFMRENGGFDNYTFNILEEYNCENKNELFNRERYYIDLLGSSLNIQIPNRTDKQYREDNKDKLSEIKKNWYLENKEEYLEKRKQYHLENKETLNKKTREYYNKNRNEILKKGQMKINCDICNSIVSKNHLTRHKKSLKCMKFQKLIENEN